jgi:hypothetical protein
VEILVLEEWKRDFWEVWTCSRMECAMAVLDQTIVKKECLRASSDWDSLELPCKPKLPRVHLREPFR